MSSQNLIGLKTLFLKEINRFLKVFSQTLLAPVVTALLFFAVFMLAFSDRGVIHNVTFDIFLAPGLIMMAVMQNAFANSSSSLIIAKIQKNIVDVLIPPLSAFELTCGYAVGALCRGVLVGFAVFIAISIFVPPHIHNIFMVLFMLVNASLMMSLIGVLSGIWAEKFDQIATITNFIITPLSFLSGTFYSTQNLTAFWQYVAHANPFFYLIDGFRGGFINYYEGNVIFGVSYVLTINILLWWLAQYLFSKGYRLKK